MNEIECGPTCQSYEKVSNIEHICRVSCCVVIHVVRFPTLIADDVHQDVYCRVTIVGCWAVPVWRRSVNRVDG